MTPRLSGRKDCKGITFAGEAETVVFLTNSGEVLICCTEVWIEVVESGIFENKLDDKFTFSADAENLLATLDRLGIDLG